MIQAYYVSGEDCQGQPSAFWRAEGRDSRGELLLGGGATEQEAIDNVTQRLKVVEEFYQKRPIEQLEHITQQERILSEDVTKAIKIIARILRGLTDARS